MSVAQSIDLLKRQGSQLCKPITLEGIMDMVFECSFAVSGIKESSIVEKHPNCPSDLVEFWEIASTAKLFEDITYGQWGLEIVDPDTAQSVTREFCERRNSDYRLGDLVIGRFLGDLDLLIIRCDPLSHDFGNILVALPIDRRNDWYYVSDSFSIFLDQFTEACGNKFWAEG